MRRIWISKRRALELVRRISHPHTPQTNLLQLLQEQLPQLPRGAAEAIPGLALRFREVAEDDESGFERAIVRGGDDADAIRRAACAVTCEGVSEDDATKKFTLG